MRAVIKPDSIEYHREFLTRLAQRKLDGILRMKVSASDLVQKTMLLAYCKWGTFEGSSDTDLRRWLAAILHRQHLKQVGFFRETRKRSLSSEEYGRCHSLVARTPSSSAILLKRESVEQLLKAIAALEPEHRMIIQLLHIEQMPVEDVAHQLFISRHAVYRRWKAALKQLAIRLKDC